MFSTSGGWEFSSKRGRGVTGKKIKDGPREGGTKVRQQKYRCIGHFWSRDRIAGILQVDGGTKDGYKWQEKCFHENLPAFPGWTGMPYLGLNRSRSPKWRTFVFGQNCAGVQFLEKAIGYCWDPRSTQPDYSLNVKPRKLAPPIFTKKRPFLQTWTCTIPVGSFVFTKMRPRELRSFVWFCPRFSTLINPDRSIQVRVWTISKALGKIPTESGEYINSVKQTCGLKVIFYF